MIDAVDVNVLPPVAADLFIVADGEPALIAGRRKDDGKITFPLPDGGEREHYEPILLAREGSLWSFTVQRFRPKSPPYAEAGDEASFKPYAVGYVELRDQIIVESRIEVEDFTQLAIGMPMRLVAVPFNRPDGPALTYAFRPVLGKEGARA